MKKRFLSVLLALALCTGLAIPAFAAVNITADEEHSIFEPGDYTFTLDTENSADSFVNQEIILYYDSNPPESEGYYAITENTTWTVKNTTSDGCDLMISFNELYKEGNHYSARNICWVLADGTFSLDYKGVDHEAFFLRHGKSVSFNFQDALAAMEIAANPDSLYDIQVGTLGDPGDHYFFGTRGSTEITPTPAFSDVPAGTWCADAVNWAVSSQITNGTGNGKFSPDEECTHIQILTFLYRAVEQIGNPSGADMNLAVQWAMEEGMIGANFNGGAFCTRADAVNYIWQALGRQDAPAGSFTDVPAGAAYARAVDWAVANGVTNGTNAAQTRFSPNDICTRGHIVTFLHRAYVPEARLK